MASCGWEAKNVLTLQFFLQWINCNWEHYWNYTVGKGVLLFWSQKKGNFNAKISYLAEQTLFSGYICSVIQSTKLIKLSWMKTLKIGMINGNNKRITVFKLLQSI